MNDALDPQPWTCADDDGTPDEGTRYEDSCGDRDRWEPRPGYAQSMDAYPRSVVEP